MSDTVNVDTLVDQAHEHLARAIEFLPASVDIAAAVYHLEQLRPTLSDLAARAREADALNEQAQENFEAMMDERGNAARLAHRVAELEAALRWYADNRWWDGGQRARTALAGDGGAPDWSKCNCGAGPYGIHARWCALAGDGGGA